MDKASDMKKIVLLGPAHPYRGGIAASNELLARTFLRRGAEVKVCSFTLQYPAFLFPGKTQYTEAPAPADLRIERRVSSVNPFNWVRVGLRLRRERPDAVVVRYWMSFLAPCLGTVCRLARSNGHTRILALTDNVVPHEKRFFDTPFTRWFIGACDGFVYMSGQVKGELEMFTRTKPALFSPHPLYDNYGGRVGREDACGALGIDPGHRYLLFFGFVRDYKGLDLLLDAVAELKRTGRFSGKKLIVAGEYYGGRAKYDEQMKRLDITEDVIVMDRFVPDGEVKYLFSAADLVVQPYRSATQSGVTQIAYSFGTPMIVTDVGGLAEIVPDGRVGYVVRPEPSAIAAAIARFYAENRGDEFTAAIAREKRRFSWEALADRFQELYRSLAVRRK